MIDDAVLEDAIHDQVMDERDEAHELLDRMTAAIGAYLGLDFGEHSSANEPWMNAILELEGRPKLQQLDMERIAATEVWPHDPKCECGNCPPTEGRAK